MLVPLGKKRITTGVLLKTSLDFKEISEIKKKKYEIKEMASIDESSSPLPDVFLKWLEWLSNYYFYPIGKVCALSFLQLKKKSKLKKKVNQSPKNSFLHSSFSIQTPINENAFLKLKKDQQRCFEDIRKTSGFRVHLLHGVTGSGKTEVYLSLIREKVKQNKKVLVLVPEISLTPQLVKTFNFKFPNLVSVLHSYLTPKEKSKEWKSITEGEKKILIGARSALFCPLKSLGLIVVDEEHESSYKQNEKLKYHARDAAIMLAKFSQIPILLVSANPSVESWKKAQEGKYVLHQIKKRIHSQKLPEIQVVDMREEKKKKTSIDKNPNSKNSTHKNPNSKSLTHKNLTYSNSTDLIMTHQPLNSPLKSLPFWMSELLYEKLKENLNQKKQSVLFLNRRGEAPLCLCQNCGYTFECPNCSVQLTLHKKNQLLCHYCNFKKKMDPTCPTCRSDQIKRLGLGTERIEKDVKALFKGVRIARADKDEISSKKALENLIEAMEKDDQIQILIGTQMIAKGLHFPHLTLIGLVLVDIGFNFPDFRASEKNFQLITQISGRSGRSLNQKGEVVLQSYNPSHISVRFSKENDYEGFAKKELSYRKKLNYPPYGRLASFRIQSTNQKLSEEVCFDLKTKADEIKKKSPETNSALQILGPSPAPYTKLKNKYRFHFLIKSPDSKKLHLFCKELLSHIDALPNHKVQIQIDIDPMYML